MRLTFSAIVYLLGLMSRLTGAGANELRGHWVVTYNLPRWCADTASGCGQAQKGVAQALSPRWQGRARTRCRPAGRAKPLADIQNSSALPDCPEQAATAGAATLEVS